MICHNHKCIFVHISKTGGSSIEKVLDGKVTLDQSHMGRYGNTLFLDKHHRAIDYQRENPKEFETYYKFSFVRNPWAREVSIFEWRRLQHGPTISFSEYIERNKSDMGYRKWICNSAGVLLLDSIYRFESLQSDFDNVCRALGIPLLELPHINNTGRNGHYSEYYGDREIGIVRDAYADDIEMFGYEYGQ